MRHLNLSPLSTIAELGSWRMKQNKEGGAHATKPLAMASLRYARRIKQAAVSLKTTKY